MREIERNSRQPSPSHHLPSHLPSHNQPSHNQPSSHDENKKMRNDDDLVFTNLFSLNKDVTKINQIGEREI